MAIIRGGNVIPGSEQQQMFDGAGAPTDGAVGTGTFAGQAPKGAIYTDTTNAKKYINGGTLASPVWKLITSAA